MKPAMFLHLIPRRIQHLLGRLDAARWTRGADLAVAGSAILPRPVDLAAGSALPLVAVVTGECFGAPGGAWEQRWFRIDVPATHAGADRVLFWRCQGETTVWLDGEAWAGLDVGHDSCAIPDHACTLWLDCGTYQTFMGGNAQTPMSDLPCRFTGAWLATRAQPAWDAFFDLDALVMLMQHVTDQDALRAHRMTNPIAYKLLPRLDRACDAFERDGIAACAEALRAIRQDFPAESWQDTATIVGHSHLDLVWLWPEIEGERKAVHTAATAMRLLERYPEFIFSYSQPASYAAIARRAPGLALRIGAAIRAGRWEATGAMEVESDTHLPCGEALLRAVLIGQRGFTALRGSPSTVCWLPDTFGFTACLPQILAAAGVRAFATTKLGWSEVTTFPYRSFRWRSPDGSEVIAHNSAHHPNGEMTLGQLSFSSSQNRQADAFPDMLLPQGYGDGGGGPTEAMCERARRLADLAQSPTARWGTVEDWFARLDERADRLPVYDGELYLERHQGILTSQARAKALYRDAEVALQLHESVRVRTGGAALSDDDWRRVVFYQFHDALPGSSIALVYEQMEAELQRFVDARIATVGDELAVAFAGAHACMYNAAPVPRRALVALPGVSAPAIRCADASLPVQVVAGVAYASMPLPALASVAWEACVEVPSAPTLTASHAHLSSDRVQARFSSSGGLESLHIDGWHLPLSGNAGLALHREGTGGDAWDIHPQALSVTTALPALAMTADASGPVLARVSGSASIGTRSTVRLSYSLVADVPWLQVDLDIDWREDASWLRFRLPTTLRGRHARFGTPFGSVLRPAQPGDDAQEARWEVPGSRWAAVTDDGGDGAAIITAAKYGWSCRDGVLHLSLLRAPDAPAPGADRGRHHIRFAIGRHRARSDDGAQTTAAEADLLYLPVPTYRGSASGPAPISLLPGSSLAPAWILPGSLGGVLRLHEVSGLGGVARVRAAGPAPWLVDVHGARIGTLESDGLDVWRFAYTPGQLLSIAFA